MYSLIKKFFVLIATGFIFVFIENAFAGVNPIFIDNIPRNEDILSSGDLEIVINYSDNSGGSGVNKDGVNFSLYKWSGTSWGNDISSNYLSGAIVDYYEAKYNISGLSYGKYKYNVEIKDSDNNNAILESIFYIDSTEVKIVSGQASNEFIVGVDTIGAPYTLSFQKDSNFLHETYPFTIQDWDGHNGLWYINMSDTGSLLNLTDNSLFVSKDREINNNGEINNNLHKVIFGTKLSEMQAAGNYNLDLSVNWNFDYESQQKGNLINGECGLSNNQNFQFQPETQLCAFGSPSGVIGINEWLWTCKGLYGGTTDYCTATKEYLCDSSTRPEDNGNIIFIDTGATVPNQVYHKWASGCGYSCKEGYDGALCQYKLIPSQFCTGGEQDIVVKLDGIEYTIAGCNATGTGFQEGVVGPYGTRGVSVTQYVESGTEDGTGGRYKITGEAGRKHYYYDWQNSNDWCGSKGRKLPSKEEYEKLISVFKWTNLDMAFNPPRAIQTQSPFNLYGVGLAGPGWSNNYGELGYYWTATEATSTNAYYFSMGHSWLHVNDSERKTEIALGTRCIKYEGMPEIEPTYLCDASTRPANNENMIYIDTGATVPNQVYQEGASACGYSCKEGYIGENCLYKPVPSQFCTGIDIITTINGREVTISGCNAYGTGYTGGNTGTYGTNGAPFLTYTETSWEPVTGVPGTIHYYYDWKNANDWCESRGPGWRLPTQTEINHMIEHFGWTTFSKFGQAKQFETPYNMYAVGAGVNLGEGKFSFGMGEAMFYWSSTTNNDTSAVRLYGGEGAISAWDSTERINNGLSVRCVK